MVLIYSRRYNIPYINAMMKVKYLKTEPFKDVCSTIKEIILVLFIFTETHTQTQTDRHIQTHTHTHTYIYIYIYIYVCVCVCVCVCVRKSSDHMIKNIEIELY